MGFYASDDGFYIVNTFDDMIIYKCLTKKGKVYTASALKIQKWWRKRLQRRLESVIKIQTWWRSVLKEKTESENYMYMLPFFVINQLVLFFRVILGSFT